MRTIMRNQETFVTTDETEMTPGNVVVDETGTRYIKCKAGATIAANEAVKGNSTAATTERGYLVPNVIKSAAIVDTDIVIGFNNTGGSVASGSFFWAKTGPIVTAKGGTTGAVAAGAEVFASATAGECDDAATGANAPLGVAITATGGAATTFSVKTHL